ncbi:hypothetical protein GCM10010517_38050 [Streptosporangium fragile]|uniref:PPM-type phosphatase domain-containing protein n=1 Tax=Streptosporangium fragile TaxID=46186 RepID=A0ABN3VYC5_9ACTN
MGRPPPAPRPGTRDRRGVPGETGIPGETGFPGETGVRGEADFLSGALAPLIGAVPTTVFPIGETRLARGDRLLLYTDGIVENRSLDILSGMDRLRKEVSRGAGLKLDALLESLLTPVDKRENRDNVALLGFARV